MRVRPQRCLALRRVLMRGAHRCMLHGYACRYPAARYAVSIPSSMAQNGLRRQERRVVIAGSTCCAYHLGRRSGRQRLGEADKMRTVRPGRWLRPRPSRMRADSQTRSRACLIVSSSLPHQPSGLDFFDDSTEVGGIRVKRGQPHVPVRASHKRERL